MLFSHLNPDFDRLWNDRIIQSLLSYIYPGFLFNPFNPGSNQWIIRKCNFKKRHYVY